MRRGRVGARIGGAGRPQRRDSSGGGKARPRSPAAAGSPAESRSKGRNCAMTVALIVDDSKVDQRFVGGVVSRHGVDTLFADNGKAALELLLEKPVDLIVTDMQMPEIDGLELVKAVRETDRVV